MIVIDVPHVSMRLGRRAKEVDDIAAAANAILCWHGYANACFAGHSFGTFCVSRICQLYPGAVDSVVRLSHCLCVLGLLLEVHLLWIVSSTQELSPCQTMMLLCCHTKAAYIDRGAPCRC